jgi:hypothetical protein
MPKKPVEVVGTKHREEMRGLTMLSAPAPAKIAVVATATSQKTNKRVSRRHDKRDQKEAGL